MQDNHYMENVKYEDWVENLYHTTPTNIEKE